MKPVAYIKDCDMVCDMKRRLHIKRTGPATLFEERTCFDSKTPKGGKGGPYAREYPFRNL